MVRNLAIAVTTLLLATGCSGGEEPSVQVLSCSYKQVDPGAGTFGGANARLMLENPASTTRVVEVVISNATTGGAELIWYFEAQPGQQEESILAEGLDCEDLGDIAIRPAGSGSTGAAEKQQAPTLLSESDPAGFGICEEFASVRAYQIEVVESRVSNQQPMWQAVTSLGTRLGPVSTLSTTPSIKESFRLVAGTWLLEREDLERACNDSGVPIEPLPWLN